MSQIQFRYLMATGLMLGIVSCGGGEPAPAQEAAKTDAAKAAADGKEAMSGLRETLKDLRGDSPKKTFAPNAAQTLPDWMPDGIFFPEDFVQTGERQMGPHTFLLGGTTDMAQNDTVSTFRSTLIDAGFEVVPADKTPGILKVVFNGNGVKAGQIQVVSLGNNQEIRMVLTKEAQ